MAEALIYYGYKQFYVASAYYEITDSGAFEKDATRFLNSFREQTDFG